MKRRKGKTKRIQTKRVVRGASEERPGVQRLSDEDLEKFNFFINGPMSSSEHLMKNLYADDTFYEQVTLSWVAAADAKKVFLYGVCKEVFKACIGLMNDKEVIEEIPGGKPNRMMKLITGAVTDAQTLRRRKLIELLVLLILFDRQQSRDEEYRIYLSAEGLDLYLGQQQDFRDLHDGRKISNTEHSINHAVDHIQRDLQQLKADGMWFLDAKKLAKQTPSVMKSKKALYMAALEVATADERLALGISYGMGYSRTSQAVHPLVGSHDYGERHNSPVEIKRNFAFLSILAMHVMHLAHKLAGIEDPKGIATVMGQDFEHSEAGAVLAEFRKDFKKRDIVLTAWNDLAEILEEHTSKYGDKAYRIRFLTQAPIPEYPEDWFPSRWITARLVGLDTARRMYEKSLNSGHLTQELEQAAREVLKRSDSELLKFAQGFFIDMHNVGALIPMLLQSGFLKKGQILD